MADDEMKKIKAFYDKYEESISYLFFGGLTTLVNIVVMFLCEELLDTNATVNNIIAWVVSVAFAYVTNKIFVFKSKSTTFKVLAREIFDFVVARLLTGAIETGAMWLFVDTMGVHWSIIKTIMAIFVILVNYVLSKLIIFKSKSSGECSECEKEELEMDYAEETAEDMRGE